LGRVGRGSARALGGSRRPGFESSRATARAEPRPTLRNALSVKIRIDSRSSQEQDRRNSVSVRVLVLGVLVSAGGWSHAAEADVSELRKELAAAQDATDNPAIIELSRRIVEANPRDSMAWETLTRAELAVADYARCSATLNAWDKAGPSRPPVIDDLRGDVANARKDYGAAERYWRLYIAARPKAAESLEKLAGLCAGEERWQDAVGYWTQAIAFNDTAGGRIRRANLYLELHEWDKALADADKANALDPSDATVKEWLPRFELVKRSLPRIKAVDAQIAKSPGAGVLWLDHARFFTLAGLPNLALKDCRRAMKLGPGMMRARVQTGEALLDLGRADEAAKLNVSYDLARDVIGHVNEETLRALGACDALVLQNPKQADPLVSRAKVLRRLNQYVLALADAQAALELDPGSAGAHFQAAHALDALGRMKEAASQIREATELNPNDPVMWYYRGLLEAQRADFDAAIKSQSRSLALRESAVALLEREKCERRTGRIAEADADAIRRKQLPTPQE
jgi:tetratricopeptide (TPR) repeat protein